MNTKRIVVWAALAAICLSGCSPQDFAEAKRIELEAQTQAEREQIALDAERTRQQVLAPVEAQLEAARKVANEDLRQREEREQLELKYQQLKAEVTYTQQSRLDELVRQHQAALADIERQRWTTFFASLSDAAGQVALAIVYVLAALALVRSLNLASVWVRNWASSLKRDKAGHLALQKVEVAGGVVFHDPEQAVTPTTAITARTWWDRILELLIVLKFAGNPQAIRLWQATGRVTTDTSLDVCEDVQKQITTQAQGHAMPTAVTRPGGQTSEAGSVILSQFAAALGGLSSGMTDLPAPRIVNDSARLRTFHAAVEQYVGEE